MPPDPIRTSPLSPYRAFVVQFDAHTNVGEDRISGRVEHVVSRQSKRFDSLQDLLIFIDQVMGRTENCFEDDRS
jgi:hypothetical protein